MDSKNISVRDFQSEDIPRVLDYWYRSPPGYIESIGVDRSKMLPESKMRGSLEQACRLDVSKRQGVTVLLGSQAVGVHLVGDVQVGESAVFHAHIWDARLRGKGISSRSYPLACQVFFERFKLKKMLFKTPTQNIAAIRVKEKLGIRSTGEEPLAAGFAKEGTRAKCFELTKSELEEILARTR